MNFKTLTIAMSMTGILTITASLGRWFFIYYDPSQAVLGTSIGIIILGFAYIHERLWNLSEEISDQGKGLDGLNIWVRDELGKLKTQLNQIGGKKHGI